MSNKAICHISVALNINFNNYKNFRDTKVRRKFIRSLDRVIRTEVFFSDINSKNTLRLTQTSRNVSF